MDDEIRPPTHGEALSMVSMAPIGIMLINLNGTIRWANDSMCRMLRYSFDELMGMHIRQVTVQHDAQTDRQAFQRMIETGQGYGMFRQWVQRGGSGIIAGDIRMEVHRELGEIVVTIGFVVQAEQAKATVESIVNHLLNEGRLTLNQHQAPLEPAAFVKKWWPAVTALGAVIAAATFFVIKVAQTLTGG